MIYSPSGRFLFARVSRTAGSSISDCLQRALPDARQLRGLEQHDFLATARPVLGPDFEKVHKFAIVRNPWDRFVSWFAMIGKATIQDNPAPESLADPEHQHWKGFDAFLEEWSADEVLIDGVARRKLSQWAQLSDAGGNLLADDVGRFESLAEDTEMIFGKLELERLPLPRLNSSQHHHYGVYYSDFGRELVAEVYSEDLRGFGYRFEETADATD